MSFQPVLPFTGYAGWLFLNRTLDQQKEAFAQSNEVSRTSDYFREHIGSVKTAEDLVADHRLLETSLKAFGLEEDIYAKAFVRKVLEEGTLRPDALANKLTDKRYAAFSKAFGFGFETPNTVLSDFADTILSRFKNRSFETTVGDVDDTMRMALNLEGALNDITEATGTDKGQWYGVMGNPAVRTVFETAMGFPASFGSLDLDQQLEQFRDRAERNFGTSKLSDFQKPEVRESLIRHYMLRTEIAGLSAQSSGSIALTLLQAG